jgi:Right handed beta helix region
MNAASRLYWAVVLLLSAIGPATAAPPQRTFVASNGADSNPCSLAAPCRSFGTAIAAVATNGEVVVLDTAGYGTFAITKSVSVTAPQGVYAGISVFSATDGVVINAPGGTVALHGLVINGQGGNRGIVVTDAAVANIDGCVLSNLGGNGLQVDTTGTVHMSDTSINSVVGHGVAVNNGSLTLERVEIRNTVSFGFGIAIFNGSVYARDTLIADSSGTGVRAEVSTGNTAKVTLDRVMIARPVVEGIVVLTSGGTATVTVIDSTVTDNLSYNGIIVAGAGATATVSRSSVARGAGYGFFQASGAFETTQDNLLRGNTSGPTNGTITPIGYN